MPSLLVENVDVFFPGQGDTLTQAPAYHWERTEAPSEVSAKEGLSEQNERPESEALHTLGVTANFYTSTRDPNAMLVAVIGTDRSQRKPLARAKITMDFTNLHYHDYDGFGVNMPGLIVTGAGNAVATCSRRHDSMSDGGHENDILSARSEDGGKTWSRQQVIHAEKGQYTFLGAIVEDRVTRTVFVTLWNIPAEVRDDLGYFSTYAEQGGGFGILQSTDDGLTWSEARHVDPMPNPDGWTGWPNNNVHGIQLMAGPQRGRLVMPGFLYKEGEPGEVPGVRGGLLYSDDHGQTWTVGAVLPDGSDEVTLVETSGGEIYVSYRRNTRRRDGRTFARSRDGGQTFYELGEHQELSGRPVHVGLARHGSAADNHPDVLLFSHPVGVNRLIPGGADMMIYVSRDEGRTWPVSKLIDTRACRYSDLAVTADGTVLCLYAVGKIRDSEKLTVARLNIEQFTA